jgi:hypothetical protein
MPSLGGRCQIEGPLTEVNVVTYRYLVELKVQEKFIIIRNNFNPYNSRLQQKLTPNCTGMQSPLDKATTAAFRNGLTSNND